MRSARLRARSAMAEEAFEPRVHLEIGSRLENVELVQIAVESALVQLDVEDEVSHEIGTAVREAVANAIQHGNSLRPDKLVEVDFGLEGDVVVIQVRDQGTGFDPNEVRDPRRGDNLLRPDGRGILLIREFMDEVRYSFNHDRGTELTMRRHVSLLREPSDRPQEESK